MGIDKSLLTGSTTLLILQLLEKEDMYGYQMIDQLSQKSNNTFELKAGTLYPLLHTLEQKGILRSYEDELSSTRKRKYYSITKNGRSLLKDKKEEWITYSTAINKIIGGASFATT